MTEHKTFDEVLELIKQFPIKKQKPYYPAPTHWEDDKP